MEKKIFLKKINRLLSDRTRKHNMNKKNFDQSKIKIKKEKEKSLKMKLTSVNERKT